MTHVCMIEARPRNQPKSLPVFPNPAPRPEGSLPTPVVNFFSEVPDGIELALGKVPQRNSAAYVRAIHAAEDRSIHCNINCAGGDSHAALAIVNALLRHEWAVHCRVVGRCSSSAAFIALAADTRTIAPNGYVLLHKARRLATPQQWEAIQRLAPDAKWAINESLCDINDAATALLKQRLGVTEETARRWLSEGRRWDAAEAFNRGFVDAIEGND